MSMGDPHGADPINPLFFPVTRQRLATRSPASFWNVSTTSNRKSSMLARNVATHALNAARERMTTPPT